MVIIDQELMGVFSYQGIVIGSDKFGLGQAIFKFFQVDLLVWLWVMLD
ncbi:hypothetical protein [Spiroplasma clarkii]|nr:hypothetical protein [Spiroplasma clarkii]